MHEPSFMSTGAIATYAKKIAQYGHPEIKIWLDDNNDAPTTYTTADSLSGHVAITAPHTTRFDEVQITFEGTTVTNVEAMSPVAVASSRVEAKHPFLKLTMPIRDSEYPQPRIAEAGETYKFPFNFVIPEHLLLNACKHECTAAHVREAHLRLPPSMGDPEIFPSDDLAPDMAKIQYAIRVRVTRTREQDAKIVVLAKGARKIRVLPAIAEAPPMHISADDSDYTLSATKTLKKGMFSGKLGKITVSASQTKALVVSPSSTTSPTILATLRLRFDPSDPSAQPPRLGSLTSKIKSSTFYAVKPLKILANRARSIASLDITRGVYTTGMSLASRCVASVGWTHHPPSPVQNIRRDSGYSTCSSGPSRTEHTVTADNKGWYEASVLVPLNLPSCKTWLPTFHSCLVSRIYSLELALSVHTPGAGVPSSTISLKLPVQISSGREGTELDIIDMETTAAEVDEDLRPRLIQVPGEEFVLGSASVLSGQSPPPPLPPPAGVEAPPGYEAFAPRRRVPSQVERR